MDYADFIAAKSQEASGYGFTADALPDHLFDFQRALVDWAVQQGRGAITGAYAGSEQHPADLLRYRGWDGDQKANPYSHWIWRRYASSVWDDVRIDRVLPFRDSRDEDDEKHVHPLQLDVIERYLDLRTSPGERVLTPFMGVGSEVYTAVQMDRYGIGVELKTSYYRQALANLEAAATDRDSSSPAMLDVVLP